MTWILIGLVLILAAGVAAVALRRRPAAADACFRLFLVAGCIGIGARAWAGLGGETGSLVLQVTLPGGPWVLGLDPLSAWFVLILAVGAAVSGLYGVSYLSRERGHRPVAAAHAMFALLVSAMVVVFLSQSALCFLIAWEVMAVTAYLLIVFEDEQRDVRRGGLIYLVLTHVGTLGLFIMFLSWGRSATDLRFASLAAVSGGLPLGGAWVLLLATIGFGVKAGSYPVHFWLPGAHAAAPSHVSALLSGVMIKTGIYGLLRIITLLGAPPPSWWGWTLLFLGLASAVLGVLWALAQHDVKRLLAYSSVENIGIILLGLGVGVLGSAYGHPAVAFLGYAGALLHTLNHALFKSLLFLGAGAVVRATGTREIDRLGGLARPMPGTALAFLVGAVAIVGLPPLNGFVSEWVTVQGLLTAGQSDGPLRFLIIAIAAVGLVAALALAAFTRVTATMFLGRERAPESIATEDAPAGMLLPMLLAAGACALVGLWPRPVLTAVGKVAEVLGLGEIRSSALASASAAGFPLVWLLGLALVGLVWLLRRSRLRHRPVVRGTTWGCAYPAPRPRMQYSGSSFSAPILQAGFSVTRPEVVRTSTELHTIPRDPIQQHLVQPVWERIQHSAAVARPLQRGRVTTYLQFIVVTVVLLLGLLLLYPGPGR
jgi:formate hydrogenlyase subunit 3/multisubunit Na+/H+ antiporter MnhD subunit